MKTVMDIYINFQAQKHSKTIVSRTVDKHYLSWVLDVKLKINLLKMNNENDKIQNKYLLALQLVVAVKRIYMKFNRFSKDKNILKNNREHHTNIIVP